MNPILIFLIFLAGVLLWLLLSFIFRPIGGFFKRLWDDAERAMNEEDNKKKE